MSWLANYRDGVRSDVEQSSPLGIGPGKLTSMWPFLAGFGVFALVDTLVEMTPLARYVLMGVCVVPGAVWFAYLYFHAFKAFWQFHRPAARKSKVGIDG